MTIAQTIRTLREMKNWSQEDMAAKLNISKSSYARLETESSQIKLHQLEKIAEIFEMDIARLLQLNDKNLFLDIVFGNNYKNIDIGNLNTSETLQHEIEKMQMTIQHLEEKLSDKELIIKNKDNEINLLKKLYNHQ